MAYFLKNGNTFKVSSKEAMDLYESLPAATYVVKFNPMTGFYLEIIENFDIPNKIYGSTIKDATRILNTYNDRGNSTGVLLAGEKGSGKTLLSKVISDTALKSGIPTIVINTPHCGEAFNTFIQDIDQPCIVLFDEFEKVYDNDSQELVLTLLDGVFSSKKLFILTCNDKWKIDTHMRNRPGRIFYMLDFEGISMEFIKEYCDDRLNNKSYTEQVIRISSMFKQMNFDMLQCIIEESNRYDESPIHSMRMLNAKPEFSNDINFNVIVSIDGKVVDSNHKTWNGNPLQLEPIELAYKKYDDAPETVPQNGCNPSSDYDWVYIYFSSNDIVTIDVSKGVYRYKNSNGECLELTKVVESRFNYLNLL